MEQGAERGLRTWWRRFVDWRAARRMLWVEKQAAARRDAPGVHADFWKKGGN
jgi:hypothetical protein